MAYLKRILLTAALVFTGAVSANHLSGHDVAKRTAPSGKVYQEGDDVPVAKAVVAEVPAGPRSGETIFNASCNACHGTGVAGAPKFGDKAAWQARIAQGEDTLLSHAINGLNAMPPKGTCADCSDEEIKATVEYMIEHSK